MGDARRVRGFAIAIPIVVALSCSWPEITPAPTLSTAGRGMVTPESGGTVRTDSGIELEVPPGAVDRPVEIGIVPLDGTAAAQTPGYLQGARFEPEGLAFKVPVRLTLPLASPATSPPIELLFKGSDPSQAIATGQLATLSSDGLRATMEIWHFSGAICARNCHGGTREFLAPRLAKDGVDLTACVQANYPDSLPPRCEDIHSDESIQAILSTFFEEIPGCCDEGQDVTPAQLQQLVVAVESGRNAVVAFNTGRFPGRGGKHGFYPVMSHTASIEIKDGIPQLRNTFVVPKVQGNEVLAALGGTNLLYHPLADINAFRRLPTAVGLELKVCGTPGCLGNDQNPPGPYNPLATRPLPWSAVRLYVERPQPTCTVADAGKEPECDRSKFKCISEVNPEGSCENDYRCVAGQCQRRCCFEHEMDAGVCERPNAIPNAVAKATESDEIYCACMPGFRQVRDVCRDLERCEPQ